ncbi:transcriptional regulator ATRX-like [Sparus aurata]|uniref:transcriptional regulator ATRX-like n=1 Tax=Sparus aurata TaxID=8175 RepID=UPI0011C0CF5D|nr:transcriptional regulator ATRX-like [Sparus aurata]
MDYYLEKGRQTFSNMFSSPPPVRYHGLLNQGATCYLNSVLQVLFMTEDFKEAVERHCCEYPATEYIDRHLKDLFDDLKGNTADTYNITKKLGIHRVYEQQDAAEYYEKILSLTSPDASQIFHGWLTDRTTCSACDTETDTDGAFWHLPLALVDSYSEHYSVVDGIKEHFRASEFSGENQMYCEKCDAKCDATIQCVMKHHPEVLMLLLKRFDFDYRYMTYVKINQTVDVPRILQIPENQTYELYAFVDHSGDLRSGHYTSTIWDEENWFTFNDSRVTLADYQQFQEDDFEKSSSAYLLFYRKQNATQTPSPVSAPGGHLPATGDVYDQCQYGGKKRGREEGEAIDRDEETERVRSRGIQLQPNPRYHENDQDTRDEVETGVKEGKGGYPETENQAEEMEPLCRVTQREESVNDQGSGKEGAPDVSNDLKPEISDMLRKEVERSVEETGVMDVKTGEDEQPEKEGKSSTNYPEDNAGENRDENLRGTQEVGQDKNKPVSENEQRDERGLRIDDKEGKTEAGERASEIGRLNHDLFSSEIQEYGRDDSRKQNMPKDDHQQGKECMDVQQGKEQKRGDGKHAKSKDTSVTERYSSEGVQAQDSDSGRRDDGSVHPEQKISITPTIQEDVELDKKGKTVHGRGMGSRPTNLLTKDDLLHSPEIQYDRRVDDNKQKVPKDDQRCKEGGSSRHEGREQERRVRRDVEGVTEKKRGDSGQPHFGQDVEDQSFVGLHDRQRMSEQKISGTCANRKDGSVETQSKHIKNRSDSSLRRAGSAGSRKPTECQEAGCGEQVRRSNSQERPGSKNIEVKMIDKKICSETVPSSSVFSNLRRAGSAGSRTPTANQGAGRGDQVRQINPLPKATREFPESTREERPGSKNIEIKITDTEICSETVAAPVQGNLSKIFARLKLKGNKRKLSDAEDQEKKIGCLSGKKKKNRVFPF